MIERMRSIIGACLKEFDWSPLNSTAVALKKYMTAVGVKEAHAYLADFGPNEDNYLLTGQYDSEGSNVLATSTVLIPKTASEDVIRERVAEFARKAEHAVLESYAARLYLRWGVEPKTASA